MMVIDYFCEKQGKMWNKKNILTIDLSPGCVGLLQSVKVRKKGEREKEEKGSSLSVCAVRGKRLSFLLNRKAKITPMTTT